MASHLHRQQGVSGNQCDHSAGFHLRRRSHRCGKRGGSQYFGTGYLCGKPGQKDSRNAVIKFADLYSQYRSIKAEIDAAIATVIRDSAFISGRYAHAFENQFQEFLGGPHCVGVANGTDALEIAIEALNLPARSEILGACPR